jgi:hypothetical protein
MNHNMLVSIEFVLSSFCCILFDRFQSKIFFLAYSPIIHYNDVLSLIHTICYERSDREICERVEVNAIDDSVNQVIFLEQRNHFCTFLITTLSINPKKSIKIIKLNIGTIERRNVKIKSFTSTSLRCRCLWMNIKNVNKTDTM